MRRSSEGIDTHRRQAPRGTGGFRTFGGSTALRPRPPDGAGPGPTAGRHSQPLRERIGQGGAGHHGFHPGAVSNARREVGTSARALQIGSEIMLCATRAPACGEHAIYHRFGLRRSRAGRTACGIHLDGSRRALRSQRRSAPNQSGDKSHAVQSSAASRDPDRRSHLELALRHRTSRALLPYPRVSSIRARCAP